MRIPQNRGESFGQRGILLECQIFGFDVLGNPRGADGAKLAEDPFEGVSNTPRLRKISRGESVGEVDLELPDIRIKRGQKRDPGAVGQAGLQRK